MSSALIGTWSLLRWYNEEENGARHFPLGPEASGFISYSADGFVFVHIAAGTRANFAVNDPFGGTEAEDSAAMKSHITYAGSFEIRGDQVVHRVTQASCPNWIGTEQIRNIEFVGDTLRLSAGGALFQGRRVTAVVDWERAAR